MKKINKKNNIERPKKFIKRYASIRGNKLNGHPKVSDTGSKQFYFLNLFNLLNLLNLMNSSGLFDLLNLY